MNDAPPPTWVTKRDGRLVPFEADRICRALFAASESLGQADPFLARELADSVVHFLAEDCADQSLATSRIAEVVVQVLRELGQPALARAFAEHPRDGAREVDRPATLADALAQAAHRFTLQQVYTRDLAAAQEAGLIVLTGLHTPNELHSCILGAPAPLSGDLLADLEEARRFVGQTVALDGLDYLPGPSPDLLADAIARGLRLTGLSGVASLNSALPPSWAISLAEGPLFSTPSAMITSHRPRAEEIFAALLPHLGRSLRVDWHLTGEDLAAPARLREPIRLALEGAPIGFVLDRPRRPIHLAEGLDRRHPAVLLIAGLSLPALLRQPGMLADADRYLQRLGSLARLVLSAAVQKRNHLRRQQGPDQRDMSRGFLLDRARCVVVPVGLDAVVQQFTGWSLATGGPALELARRIVVRLMEVLRKDGRAVQIEANLDSPYSLSLDGSDPASLEQVAGISTWGSVGTLKSQARAGSAALAPVEAGTLALFFTQGEERTPSVVLETLELLWRQTEVTRVRFLTPAPQQATLWP
ncbi:MAG: ATP cone domain-containing protein [Gemmataceae bacterium]